MIEDVPTILTIPIGVYADQQVWESIDIEHMTGEEFIQWIKFVYPGGLETEDPEIFADADNRKKIYEIILAFWTRWSTPGVQNPIGIQER